MNKITSTLGTLTLLFGFSAFALDASQPMGQGLFEQKGSNSCSFCHGIDGTKGNVAAAANLSKPTTWKVFKALGGQTAFGKDPKAFVKKMHDATIDLIKGGAIRHNATFKESWFNWKAPGVSPYNAQMLGLGGAASKQWLDKFKDKGVTPEIAAESAWLHVQTLDKEGIFSKAK